MLKGKNTTLLAMALSMVLLFVLLAACTTPGDEPVAGNDPTATEEPAEEPTADPEEPVSSDDATPTAEPEEEEPADGEMLIKDAVITGVQILMMESWPLQARVQIDGELGDGCTELEPITTEREGDTFYITVRTARPADATCTLELRLFSESVSLDIEGLEAGTYTVDVNGTTETFTLEQDNVMAPDTEDGEGEMLLSEDDQRELIRLTLERALIEQEIPDYALLADQGDSIVLSTENINPELLPELEGLTLELLTPEEIQARANEEGDFVYVNFDRFESSAEDAATVSLSSRWAAGEDSDMIYLSGGGFTIEYTRVGDNWMGEITESWIS